MVSLDAASFDFQSMNGGKSCPDIFDRMKASHGQLRFLMARLRQSRDGAPEGRRLFDMLCDAVEAYGAASEQSLYAELLAYAEQENKWPARHAVGVHDMSQLLLFELSSMEMAGDAWRAGIGQLAKYLEDHFRAEAGEIFRLAKTLLHSEQAARLGDRYEQARLRWIECFGRVPATSQAGL